MRSWKGYNEYRVVNHNLVEYGCLWTISFDLELYPVKLPLPGLIIHIYYVPGVM